MWGPGSPKSSSSVDAAKWPQRVKKPHYPAVFRNLPWPQVLYIQRTAPSPAGFHHLPFSPHASIYSLTPSANKKNFTTVKKKKNYQLSKQITRLFIQTSHSHMIIRCCHTNDLVPPIPPQLTLSSLPCSTPELYSCKPFFWPSIRRVKISESGQFIASQYNPSEVSINLYHHWK